MKKALCASDELDVDQSTINHRQDNQPLTKGFESQMEEWSTNGRWYGPAVCFRLTLTSLH